MGARLRTPEAGLPIHFHRQANLGQLPKGSTANGGKLSSPNPLPDQLKSIWASNGLPIEFLSNLTLLGVGLAAQISVALAGLSAAYLHYLRTGITQNVTVDARHAASPFVHSEAWYTVDDAIPAGDVWDNIAGLYKTKDGGWVRIHTNFPHHRAGDACAAHGMCVFKLRTLEEWERTAHAQALAAAPLVDVRRAGGAPKRRLEGGGRPLGGVKVLDLSRVLAGPVAGRTLAAHGAQVLLVTSPTLPSLPLLDTETSLGKRTTQLDLTTASDRERFRNLVKDADVFLQAYRPGGIEAQGFGVADVIKIREECATSDAQGVVYASLRAWGWDGPGQGDAGCFDSLVQTATGFNADEGAAAVGPRALPVQALDHAAGYLLAFGVNVALCRALQASITHPPPAPTTQTILY
ncbi:CoA-transferase family III domain-containing protein [Pholiota molesta]|nr:CoA-transferase family III domain-containing protein [Pholiota molesta]